MSNLLPLSRNVTKIDVAKKRKTPEITKGSNAEVIGFIIATTPKTSVIFAKTVPDWSPIAISLCPNLIAFIPKINSGSVVAIEIKNKPMIISGTLKSIAIR